MRLLANEILQGALKNLGVSEEGGNNRGKWVEHYLKSVDLKAGNPWCAAFVYYRYLKASQKVGIELKDFPKSGYTPDFKKWAENNKRWTLASTSEEKIINRPEPGDLVCFYFESKKRIAHIGIVEKSNGRGVWVVAGNTASGDDDEHKTSDGDGVFKKFYSYDSLGEFGGFVSMRDPIIKKAEVEGLDVKIV